MAQIKAKKSRSYLEQIPQEKRDKLNLYHGAITDAAAFTKLSRPIITQAIRHGLASAATLSKLMSWVAAVEKQEQKS